MRRATQVFLGVCAICLVSALSACGSSGSASLLVLFDSSASSSQIIREGYRDGATLIGLAFCQQHPGSGEIDFNWITATPEADSQFKSLPCPSRTNETQFKAALIAFQPQLQGTIDDFIGQQAPSPGTDIIDAILYGASQTFDRFHPTTRILVVFSDMEQSGSGVRNCILKAAVTSPTCLELYYKERPNLNAKRPELTNTAVFVVGVGQTIRGPISDIDLFAYNAFWRAFFDREKARMCWYAPGNLPEETFPDGTTAVNPKYFRSDCPPVSGY